MTSRSRTRPSLCIGTLCLCVLAGAGRFINPQPLTPEGRVEAARRLETLQIRRSDDVLFRGKPVNADAQGDYPVWSVGRFIASGAGGPAVVTVVREPEGWKVDLRWWLAMLDMANGQPTLAGSPDHAIRSLTLALIALDRDEAFRFVAPGAEISILFAGAPSVREPSGVLEATAMEMPLVEVGTGKFYRMPSGRIVEGSTAGDRKVGAPRARRSGRRDRRRRAGAQPPARTAADGGRSHAPPGESGSRGIRGPRERGSSGCSGLSRCRSCSDALVAPGASSRSRTSR